MAETLMVDADIWLYDFLQVRSMQLQQVKEYRIEKFLQGSEQLSFRLPLDDPKIAFLHEDQLVFAEGAYWYIDRFEDRHPGDKTVICNARHITELTWRVRFGNFSVLAQTPANGLNLILAGSDWTVASAPASIQLYTMEEIDASLLSLLRRWAAITGYELQFDTVARTVTMTEVVGTFKPIGFRWGYSIKEIERTFYPPQATRLYPVGANDLTISGPNPTGLPYIEDYSFYEAQGLTTIQARALYRKDLTWVDDRYLLAVNLYDAAVARLAKLSKPRVFYSAKVLDLSKLMNGNPGYEVGDTTVVDDEEIGVLENVRVTRTVRYPRDPKKDEVELGFQTNGLLDVSDGGNRSIDYSQLFTIVDQNDDPLNIATTTVNYNTIALTSAGAASFLAGSTFVGTATGTGTIEFRMVVDGVVVGKAYSFPFTNGQLVEFSWPSFSSDLPEGAHVVDWRAQVISGSGTVALGIGHGRSWVISSGAVGVGINASPNAYITEVFTDADMHVVSMTDEYTMELLMVPIMNDIVEEDLTDGDMPAIVMTESFTTPWRLEDPVFGELEGPGVLSGPDDPVYSYTPPPGGSTGGNLNFGPGGLLYSDPIRPLNPILYLINDYGIVTTVGGGTVASKWKDKMGLYDAVSLSGREPAWGTHQINGVNVLRVDSGDVMQIPDAILTALDAAGAGEVFYVTKNDTNDANQGAPFQGFQGAPEYHHQNFSDGKWYAAFGSTTRKDTGNPSRDASLPTLFNIRSAPGAWSAYAQDALHFTTSTNSVDFTGGPSSGAALAGAWLFGNVQANNGSGVYWAGLMGAFIVFPYILSAPQRAIVVSHLNSRFTLGI